MRRDGFALIELLVLIAIIAILATILFPVSHRRGRIVPGCDRHRAHIPLFMPVV
jgi:prepilin-type N-terminal cleavage/methylation domain-containing protein